MLCDNEIVLSGSSTHRRITIDCLHYQDLYLFVEGDQTLDVHVIYYIGTQQAITPTHGNMRAGGGTTANRPMDMPVC